MTTTPILLEREREILDMWAGRDPRYFGPHPLNGGTWQEVKARAKYDSLDAAGKAAFKAQEETRKTADKASKAAEEKALFDGLLTEAGMECTEDAGTEGSAVATVATKIITESEPPAPTVALSKADPVTVESLPKARRVLRADSGYEFPKIPVTSMSASDLCQSLEELTKQFKASSDYAAVREQFCAISIALNEQGLWAPKFRPQPRISPVAPRTPSNMALNRDHLVIDAHWLWANETLPPSPVKYERLLNSSQPFDFASAAVYAQEEWKADFRAESVFFLPLAVQWQLCKTHTPDLIDRYRALTYGDRAGKTKAPALIDPIRKVINSWSRGNHRIRGHEDAYANLWLAREMLGAKAVFKDVGVLAGLMAGTAPLDASTVRNKLKGLDARLEGA